MAARLFRVTGGDAAVTTQINDIHDLLRLLEERPDLAVELRQRILTPELLAMPEQMAALTARVDRLAEQVAGLTLQMAALTERVDGLTEQMAALTARVDELSRELREFVREQREINREQQEFNRRLEGRVNTLTGQMGNFRGRQYERDLKRRLPHLLYSRCQLDHYELLHNPEENLPPQLLNALRGQQRAGKITAEELGNLLEADYIARAQGMEDAVERYVVVEAALTVDDRDIERARGRADTLERATGVATLALVVGETINPPQWSRAQGQGVTLLQVDA